MSGNQEAMRASIKAADLAKVSAVTAAASNYLGTIGNALAQSGVRPGFPTGFSTYDAARIAADKQRVADLFAAESARQAAVFIAKDLLRSQGEIAF